VREKERGGTSQGDKEGTKIRKVKTQRDHTFYQNVGGRYTTKSIQKGYKG
jgi:hypothetical protein